MGQAEVEGFLTMLATEKQVSPATHRKELNVLLFLYRQVLGGFKTEVQNLPTRTDIRTVQELLVHSDVSSTMTYTHVLRVAAGGTASPLDAIAFANLGGRTAQGRLGELATQASRHLAVRNVFVAANGSSTL